jgi:hypothetical protein
VRVLRRVHAFVCRDDGLSDTEFPAHGILKANRKFYANTRSHLRRRKQLTALCLSHIMVESQNSDSLSFFYYVGQLEVATDAQDVSAKEKAAQQGSRVPQQNEHAQRQESAPEAQAQGEKEAVRVTVASARAAAARVVVARAAAIRAVLRALGAFSRLVHPARRGHLADPAVRVVARGAVAVLAYDVHEYDQEEP